MYSGTTFRVKSGQIVGVHQRIDRAARRQLKPLIPSSCQFPSIKQILHFEGLNGPDGIKRKSPGVDEPWHFIDPDGKTNQPIYTMIDDHAYNLRRALVANNIERAAFEAAWMAHAVTDALTPPHHYPLEKKLEELRGEGMATRTSKVAKLILPGSNLKELLKHNWEAWGTHGVMTTHFGFELGVATTVASMSLATDKLSSADIAKLQTMPYRKLVEAAVHEVAELHMYEDYAQYGWTRALISTTRRRLLPIIVKTVALGWYSAIEII